MKLILLHLKKWLKGEHTTKDVIDYFRGNIRYWMFYNAMWLMRPHILEQIEYRVQVMKSECYHSGHCVVCGCKTLNLQMANKACEGHCYPPMMSRKVWEEFKQDDDGI